MNSTQHPQQRPPLGSTATSTGGNKNKTEQKENQKINIGSIHKTCFNLYGECLSVVNELLHFTTFIILANQFL